MRRAIGLAWRLAPFCACLPACRPSDFDDLSRGEHASVDMRSSDEAPDGQPAVPDADDVDSENDASVLDAQQVPDDAATVGAEKVDAGTLMDAGRDVQNDGARDADPSDATPNAAAPVGAPPSADAGPITIELPILADQDDALWRTTNAGLEELLHFGPAAHGPRVRISRR